MDMNNRLLNLANINFDLLDLGAPPRLTRTYKAYCPICLFRLETTDPNKRDVEAPVVEQNREIN